MADSAFAIIARVAIEIHAAVETAKANAAQCRDLARRVDAIVGAVETRQRVAPCDGALLQRLLSTISSALDLITRHGKKHVLHRVVRGGAFASSFARLDAELSAAINDLHLESANIAMAQRSAQEEDLRAIKDMLRRERPSVDVSAVTAAERWEIPWRDVVVHKDDDDEEIELGRGSFGVVYEGSLDDLPVAVKEISLGAGESAESVQREVELIGPLSHKGIIGVLGYAMKTNKSGGTRLRLVMERLEGGGLDGRIHSKGASTMDERTRRVILRGIVDALVYLHANQRNPIIHRDLKPSNIMFRSPASHEPVIVDFGLARAKEGSKYRTSDGGGGGAGTTRYMAPEMVVGSSAVYSRASDMYALGVLLCELFSGQRPFAGTSDLQLISAVSRGSPPVDLELLPFDLRELARACLSSTPTARPSCEVVAIQLMMSDKSLTLTRRPPAPLPPAESPLVARLNALTVTEAVAVRVSESEIRSLVALLTKGSEREQSGAASALGQATANASNRDVVVRLGAIDGLVRVLRRGDSLSSMAALRNLSLVSACHHDLLRAGVMEPYIELIRSGSDATQVDTAIALRNLTLTLQVREAALALGAVEPLVEMIRTGSDRGKRHAAATLGNMAKDSDVCRRRIAEAGGIAPLVALLQSPVVTAREIASVGINNVSLLPETCAEIVGAGAIAPLTALVQSGSDATRVSSLGALLALVTTPAARACLLHAHGIATLVTALENPSTSLRAKQHASSLLSELYRLPEGKNQIAANPAALAFLKASPQWNINKI